MDLHQIHREDMFGPCLGEFEGQGHQGQKTAFFGPFSSLHVVYVWYNIFSLYFKLVFIKYILIEIHSFC